MNYNGSINRSRIYQAREWGAVVAWKIPICNRCCSFSHPSLPRIQDAGLPLYSSCAIRQEEFARSRTQNCFYCQTSYQFGTTTEEIIQKDGRILERHCVQSVRRFSQEDRAWVGRTIPNRLRCFTVLIDCRRKNFLKSMSCWFPIPFFHIGVIQRAR
jgi:hypothetical protein